MAATIAGAIIKDANDTDAAAEIGPASGNVLFVSGLLSKRIDPKAVRQIALRLACIEGIVLEETQVVARDLDLLSLEFLLVRQQVRDGHFRYTHNIGIGAWDAQGASHPKQNQSYESHVAHRLNVAGHRPGAKDVKYETEPSSPGSVRLLCSASVSFRACGGKALQTSLILLLRVVVKQQTLQSLVILAAHNLRKQTPAGLRIE